MSRLLKVVGNEGNPNKLGDVAKAAKLGAALQLGAMTIREAVADDAIVLPEQAKALAVITGYAVAGGVTGILAAALPGEAPATGEVGVDINGNLVFFATDAVTEAEVTYTVAEGDLVESTGVLDAAGLLTLPGSTTARILLSASVGGSDRTVVARGTAPAAGEAGINDAGAIAFNVADAGLVASVRYIEFPANSVADRLAGSVEF